MRSSHIYFISIQISLLIHIIFFIGMGSLLSFANKGRNIKNNEIILTQIIEKTDYQNFSERSFETGTDIKHEGRKIKREESRKILKSKINRGEEESLSESNLASNDLKLADSESKIIKNSIDNSKTEENRVQPDFVPAFSSYFTSSSKSNPVKDSDDEIIKKIQGIVSKALVYPPTALRSKIQGVVRVSFNIAKDGSPLNVRVENTSGYSLLDSAAVEAVKKGSKYPVVSKTVIIPVRFNLK